MPAESHEPVISFTEPEWQKAMYGSMSSDGDHDKKTPSEVSASINSDATRGIYLANSELTTTAPSLFGEDGPETPQLDLNADFFSTISHVNILMPHMNSGLRPHMKYGMDSSIAAIMGSGPSSVMPAATKSLTFWIYPADELDTDRLVTSDIFLYSQSMVTKVLLALSNANL